MAHKTSIKKIAKIVRLRNLLLRRDFKRMIEELTQLELKLAAEVAKHYISVYLFCVTLLLSTIALVLAIIIANATFNVFGLIPLTQSAAKGVYRSILIGMLIGLLYLGLKFELYNKLYLECLEIDNKLCVEEEKS